MGAGKFNLCEKINIHNIDKKNLCIVEIGSENGEGSTEYFCKKN